MVVGSTRHNSCSSDSQEIMLPPYYEKNIDKAQIEDSDSLDSGQDDKDLDCDTSSKGGEEDKEVCSCCACALPASCARRKLNNNKKRETPLDPLN